MKAALYTRISKDITGEMAGVTRQEEDCRALAERMGATITAVFSDNDVSAYKGKARPGYRALLTAVASGTIDSVIVWHTDRLYRRMADLEEYISICQPANVPTYAVQSGPLDLATPSGRMIARQLGAVAQYESEQKAERQRRANQQRAEQGKHFGTRRPFGYEIDGKTIRMDEAQAIRQAFGWVLDGVSLREVARRWNALGLRTPQAGSEWTGDVVTRTMKTARLAGMREYRREIVRDDNGEPIKAEWPAIVDLDTWRAVQAKFNDPSRRRAAASQQLLSGVARCSVCQAVIQSGGSRNGQRRYRCSKKAGHVYRAADPVDRFIEDLMMERLSRKDARSLFVAPQKVDDVAAVRAELAKLQKRDEAIAEAYTDGGVSLAQLKASNKRSAQRRIELEARLPMAASPVIEKLLQAADVVVAWKNLDMDVKRSVIDTALKIWLVPPGTKENAYLDWRSGVVNPETVPHRWRSVGMASDSQAGSSRRTVTRKSGSEGDER